jgi:hypothetical protein
MGGARASLVVWYLVLQCICEVVASLPTRGIKANTRVSLQAQSWDTQYVVLWILAPLAIARIRCANSPCELAARIVARIRCANPLHAFAARIRHATLWPLIIRCTNSLRVFAARICCTNTRHEFAEQIRGTNLSREFVARIRFTDSFHGFVTRVPSFAYFAHNLPSEIIMRSWLQWDYYCTYHGRSQTADTGGARASLVVWYWGLRSFICGMVA